MAKFRKVHTAFWDDPLMEKLSPDARYFYLFLMTNPLCTECGIYQITIRKMCNYTGYNEDSIKALIKLFEVEYSRIVYDTSTEEICLLKKPNYIENTGKPVLDCLKSEFLNIKNKSLISRQLKHIERDVVRGVYETLYVPSNKIGQEEEEKKKRREEDDEVQKFPKMTEKEFKEFSEKLKKDQLFLEPLFSSGFKKEFLDKWILRYHIHIVGDGKTNKDYSEYRKHFKNWLNKQDFLNAPPALTSSDKTTAAYIKSEKETDFDKYRK